MSDKGINKFLKVLAVVILLPLAIIIPTLSLEGYYTSPTNAQTNDSSSYAKRRKMYLAAFDQKLSTAEEDRIKIRCLAVQSNIKTLAQRVADVQTKRHASYSAILTELDTLSKNLDKQAFDITKLNKNINELRRKVNEFETTLTSYRLALDDMTTINCAQDPTAFKATLEAARQDHLDLIGQVADIRAYILNTLKPTLQIVRQQLVDQQAPGESR